ncbi:MAG TPA: DUF1580 domain-containing protein [Isosphaeraceae bacterium]|jgi:hypothetical protein|nr:DUF1580 domain-containing protein [Isosphaeraceae bacterium]
MAIDIEREPIFPLRLASRQAKNLLVGRRDKPIHVATWYRWAGQGCRGERLETLQVGGARYTSVAAIQRFFEALSRARDSAAGTQAARCGARSQRDDASIEAELDVLGIGA